jgi:hypothetical protein
MGQVHWNIEGKSCGFWVDHADPCSQTIHVGSLILVALTTIALVGGVLLILAQRGYSLGPLNALAKNVFSGALYTEVVIAGALLVANIALICYLRRAYINQVYSKEELEQMDVSQKLTNNVLPNDLPPMHYDVFIDEPGDDRPKVYAVLSQDSQGGCSIVAFKNFEPVGAYLHGLEVQGFRAIDKQRSNGDVVYTYEDIVAVTDQAILDHTYNLLEKNLVDGLFATAQFFVRDRYKYYLALAGKENGLVTYHFLSMTYTTTELAIMQKGAELFPNLLYAPAVQRAVDEARSRLTHPISVTGTSYSAFITLEGGQRKEIFILSHLYSDPVKGILLQEVTEFFLTVQLRTARMTELNLTT